MRNELAQYVTKLFTGRAGTDDIQQEILQNTLDRYDDLIEQGKSPEAAYRLSIEGIGDINEILGAAVPQPVTSPSQPEVIYSSTKKLLRGIAIGIYILSPVPLFITDGDSFGLCGTLILIALATVLMIFTGKAKSTANEPVCTISPTKQLKQTCNGFIWGSGVPLYIALSFITGAWYITWILFPLFACIQGLINAIIDLKEACNHEN